MAHSTAGKTVADAVKEARKNGTAFRSTPHYNPRGDYLSIYFTDTPAYAERVDPVLTIYRSMIDNEIVGCKIKGVSILAENVVNVFKIRDQEIEIRLLLLNALGPHKPQHYYYDLSEKCGETTVPVKEILRKAA